MELKHNLGFGNRIPHLPSPLLCQIDALNEGGSKQTFWTGIHIWRELFVIAEISNFLYKIGILCIDSNM